jgi:predicted acylesterase/phospholipase RssA
MAYRVLSRDEHFQAAGPKRILALDGGGVRGILTLGILRAIERELAARHRAGSEFRLSHYFDLIAGTSTGAIIAAGLASGMTVEDVIGHYGRLGREVFSRGWFRPGLVRAQFDSETLARSLREVFGAATTLGDDRLLQTGLLVMTKRLDTGSPWPLANNPRGRYFRARPGDKWISNGDYPLWQVVRASTAAPSFFDPEEITIAQEAGKKDVVGTFVDGGVSPFNNPALQAVQYATLDGYHVNWQMGADQLLVVSVGTGAADAKQAPSSIAAVGAMRALLSLMDDCASLVETMMQWMSASPTARTIDRELGDLQHDLVGGAPLLSYLRYDVALTKDGIDGLGVAVAPDRLPTLAAMDDASNMDLLLTLGTAVGGARVESEHFGASFDLR